MRLGALRNDRHDSGSAQLHTLLDGPFHAIKLEDGEKQSQAEVRGSGNNFAQFEFDPAIGDADDAAAADVFTGCDIKFLPDAGAKHVRQMVGVGAYQSSAAAGDFVGDPAAASHWDAAIVGIGVEPEKIRANPKNSRLSKGTLRRRNHGAAEATVNETRSPEDVFHFAQQSAALGTIFHLRQSFEFLQQFALALVQLPRSLHPHFDEQIAFAVSVEYRHALAADAQRCARLGPSGTLRTCSPSRVGTLISAPSAAWVNEIGITQ